MNDPTAPSRRGRPKGVKSDPKPGSRLHFKRLRAKLILQQTHVSRLLGWTNSRILEKLHETDPSISLDMVNKAVAVLVKTGQIDQREKGNKRGMKPQTRRVHLRVIDFRLQGESYEDIAKAEGLEVITVKMILNKNHVRKGSVESYVPFDPSKLNTDWKGKG